MAHTALARRPVLENDFGKRQYQKRAAGPGALGRRSKLPFGLGQLWLPRRRPASVDKVICASGLSVEERAERRTAEVQFHLVLDEPADDFGVAFYEREPVGQFAARVELALRQRRGT